MALTSVGRESSGVLAGWPHPRGDPRVPAWCARPEAKERQEVSSTLPGPTQPGGVSGGPETLPETGGVPATGPGFSSLNISEAHFPCRAVAV